MDERMKRVTYANCASGYVFDWNLYVACNYRCPYCYFDGYWAEMGRRNRVPPLPLVLRAWERAYERYGECSVLLNGGEPTVYPGFAELMRGIGRRHRWSFNTNLSWTEAQWREFARGVDPSKGAVQASFHPTETRDVDGFIAKALLLRALGFRGGDVCIVAHPPVLGELESFVARFRAAGIVVRCQPFVGSFQGRRYPEGYSDDEKRRLAALNADGSSLAPDMGYAVGTESPLGKPCRTGQYYCHIDQRGEVYRCTQVLEPADGKGPLGNFFEDFALWDEPRPCPKLFCGCGESRYLVERCG